MKIDQSKLKSLDAKRLKVRAARAIGKSKKQKVRAARANGGRRAEVGGCSSSSILAVRGGHGFVGLAIFKKVPVQIPNKARLRSDSCYLRGIKYFKFQSILHGRPDNRITFFLATKYDQEQLAAA